MKLNHVLFSPLKYTMFNKTVKENDSLGKYVSTINVFFLPIPQVIPYVAVKTYNKRSTIF
jgi:hypothetical protein